LADQGEVLARVKHDESRRINNDARCCGVQIAPFYGRSTLVNVTTRTVLANLVLGCLLGS